MTLFIGLILSPLAITALILSLSRGKIWNKITSIILFMLLPIILYVWFDTGVQLKSSEDFFVKKGYGQYSDYTAIEKQKKIKELEIIKKKEWKIFYLSSFAYWTIFIGLIGINIVNVKIKK